MDIKNFIRDYLDFTRKERIAIGVIISLFIIILVLPLFIKKAAVSKYKRENAAWLSAVRQLKSANPDTVNEEITAPAHKDRANAGTENQSVTRSPGLFYFDPNKISADQWKRLGVNDKTISTIQKYLFKGGSFKKPEDLQKIYGLGLDKYKLLAPYIKIDSSPGIYPLSRHEKEKNYPVQASLTTSHFINIDINTADTTAFISLPGIGSKLASRIISFREKLGGFYSVDQISETYGLQDSVFKKIKTYLQCNNAGIKKLNVNTATKDELKAHPYIRWSIANAVIEYRNQHGRFTSLEDLKKINALDETVLNKLMHYLTL